MGMSVKDVALEERRQMMVGMFNYWKSFLNLQAWDLELSFDLPEKWQKEIQGNVQHDDENYGYTDLGLCLTPYAGEWARIFINPKVLKMFEDDQLERLIVHELCHCVTHQLDEFVENSYSFIKPKTLRDFFWTKEYDRHSEILVDHLAYSYTTMRKALCPNVRWLEFTTLVDISIVT